MKKLLGSFLATLALCAMLVIACDFSDITTSSVIVLCVVDNDTLHLDVTGAVADSALICADMADSLSIVVP